jgi:histidinol dehydrogenase
MDKLIQEMPRRAIIEASLGNRGAMILAKDLDEACEIANYIAPEHLELSVENAQEWAPKIRHAGAIFMGKYTSESLGRLLRRPEPRVAHQPHRPLLFPAGHIRFPKTLQPDSSI